MSIGLLNNLFEMNDFNMKSIGFKCITCVNLFVMYSYKKTYYHLNILNILIEVYLGVSMYFIYTVHAQRFSLNSNTYTIMLKHKYGKKSISYHSNVFIKFCASSNTIAVINILWSAQLSFRNIFILCKELFQNVDKNYYKNINVQVLIHWWS
jgi:hypothetical protein